MNLTTYKAYAASILGNPIDLYASAPLEQLLKSRERPLLFFGGVHGDEPEGVELAESTLKWLSNESPKKIRPFALILNLNPDGYFAKQRTNARGVDLNRNYPSSGWTEVYDESRYNPGPAPASEPETRVVVDLIEQIVPELVIHCHSWNPCIVVSGPETQPEGMALARHSGYELTPSIGYPTPGSLSEYCWKDRQLPVICIEAQEHSPLTTIWPIFKDGIKEVFTL